MDPTEQLIEIIKDSFREKAKEVFDSTQESCPVITGTLKKSGSFFDTPSECGLMYTAPYSELVNDGIKPGVKTTRAYLRRDGVRVGSYTYYTHGRKGRHFVDNAVDSGAESIAQSVDDALRSNFKVI